jgi:hypothetical protein
VDDERAYPSMLRSLSQCAMSGTIHSDGLTTDQARGFKLAVNLNGPLGVNRNEDAHRTLTHRM